MMTGTECGERADIGCDFDADARGFALLRRIDVETGDTAIRL